MIALLLSSVVMLSVVIVFVNTQKHTQENQALQRLQENGRYALRTLSYAWTMAGFLGGIDDPSQVDRNGTDIDPDCATGGADWALDLTAPLFGFTNNATNPAGWSCLTGSTVAANNDIVEIRYVSPSDAGSLSSGNTYLRANGRSGTLFQGTTQPATPVGTAELWRFHARLFYIRNFGFTAGDGIPSLCEKHIASGSTQIAERCLASGVERMHFEFDIDNDGDFEAEYRSTNPSAAELSQAVRVHIYLLMRSQRTLPQHTSDTEFQLGSLNINAANDNFMRQVYSTSVVLRNSPAMRMKPL